MPLRSDLPLIAIAIALFGIAGGLLWPLGYNYDGISGGNFSKLHPSTYMIVAMVTYSSVLYGNPIGYVLQAVWMRPACLLMLLVTAALFINTVSQHAPGIAGSIDTFLPPPLLMILLLGVDARGFRRLEITLHVLMSANAALGILEFVINYRFFPYRFDGAVFPFDLRSSALQGHPLANAAITAHYMMALLSGSRNLAVALRLSMFGLQSAALVTFGGRTAIVVSAVLAFCYGAVVLHRALRAGRIPILGAAAFLILAGLLPLAFAALAAGGFFDAILRRFEADGGSAYARIAMFGLFDSLSFRDVLTGPDVGLVDSLRRVNGLEWGIENPIVNMTLYQGVIVTALMTVAVSAFMREVALLCGRGVWMPMLSFVLLVNTSESLSSKTTILTKFVLLIMCLHRPGGGTARL